MLRLPGITPTMSSELRLRRPLAGGVPPLLEVSLGLSVRVLRGGFRVDDRLVEAHTRALRAEHPRQLHHTGCEH